MNMRGRSFKLAPFTLSLVVVVIMLLLSPVAFARAYNSNLTISGGVPDIPGAGVITGIGVAFGEVEQLDDVTVRFIAKLLGFAETRGIDVEYLWDFGDGSKSNGPKNVLHIYNSSLISDDYMVSLKACGGNGHCSATIFTNITVYKWTNILVIGFTVAIIIGILVAVVAKEIRKR